MEQYKRFSNKIVNRILILSKSSRVRYGFPFVIFIVVGSFGLEQFTAIKFKYRNTALPVYEQAKKAGIEMKKPGEVSLESVYETVKDLDIDHWENKRGPRPWEENNDE